MKTRLGGTRRLASSLVGRATLGMVTAVAALALLAPVAVASPESDAADAIDAAWTAAGGDGSVLGAKDGDVYAAGSGFGQNFASGAIFFSPDTGAKIMYGAILEKYRALGGPADSDLGFPTIDEGPGRISPDSRNSTFSAADQPVIFWTPDTGAWVVRGAVNAAWDRLGGSAGVLGVPIADETVDGSVLTQKFSGGQISFDTSTKTFTTEPPDLAGQLADLAIPGDATSAINAAYRAAGGPNGPLGARQGEQFAVGPDGAGQAFAGGKIFFSPATGAYAVTGAVLEKYESAGGPTGSLGLPNAPEVDGGVPNSVMSSFAAQDNPVIFASPDHGAVIVRGAMKAAWDKLGGPTGALGVPVSDQSADGAKLTQEFSGGRLTWDADNNSFTSDPAKLAESLGGLDVPAGPQVPEAPKVPNPPKDNAFSFHMWWLWWIIPLAVLLLGSLLALLYGRRRRGASGSGPEDAADLDDFDAAGDGGRWSPADAEEPGPPAPRWRAPESADAADVGSRPWAVPDVPNVGLGVAEPVAPGHDLFGHRGAHAAEDDQDAVDTAPTRVQSDTGDGFDDDFATGRHAAIDRPAWFAEEPWGTEPGSPFEQFRRPSPAAEDDLYGGGPYGEAHPAGFDIASPEEAPEAEPGPGYADDRDLLADLVPDDAYLEQRHPMDHVDHMDHGDHGDHVEDAQEDREAEAQDEPPQAVAPAIHLPLENPAEVPEGYPVKGSITMGMYYTPDDPRYDEVIAEIWFADIEHAQANGLSAAED